LNEHIWAQLVSGIVTLFSNLIVVMPPFGISTGFVSTASHLLADAAGKAG
jgi:hypothetical protein